MKNPYAFIPTQGQWEGWLADPVTQFFQKVLSNRREDIKEKLAEGLAFEDYEHAIATCKVVAGITDPRDLEYRRFVATEVYSYGVRSEDADDEFKRAAIDAGAW